MSLFYSRALWFMLTAFFFSYTLFIFMGGGFFLEFTMYSFNSVQFVFPVIVDSMSLLLMSVVFFISANVLQFSNLYMEDEVYIVRLTHLVLLLIGSMMALIFIPHITALLLGWDGLGLVSFLLVVLYASNKALGAGMLTALSNRVGDAFILVSISLFYEFYYHLDAVCLAGHPVGCLFLMVAAMTKSAQWPFSSWLPAAMEAPTPVSALVHSSTLVTAGVYLMIRLYSFLSSSPFFNFSILVIGAVTSLFAGMSAMVELDLKKVVALSTLSQLGFMMMSIGLGYPSLAFLHLITHAMLKALLLICSGCIIHLHGHAQDIRQMGGMSLQIPVVTSSFCVSSFSLCAVPLMSGFYSKDAILECFFFSPFCMVVVLLSVLSTIFTSMYSMRLLLSGVLGGQKSSSGSRFSEPVVLPMMALSFGAIIGGSMIFSSSGPYALEPFNCYVKPLLTCILIAAPLFVACFSVFPNATSFLKSKIFLYVSGATMFFLSTVTSQKVLAGAVCPSRELSYSDQSWFESGQSNIFSLKVSTLMNFFVGAGTLIVLIFFMFF